MPERRNLTPQENAILLAEVGSLCPIDAKTLTYEKKGRQYKSWEGAHIYPLNPTEEEIELLKDEERIHEDVNNIRNFIALCKECHTRYDNPRTVEEYRQLLSIKKNILSKKETRSKYADYQIEKEIKEVIKSLVEESDEELYTPLNYDALQLDIKADDTLSRMTKNRIRHEITENYIYIRQLFKEMDSQYPRKFKSIASQVRSFHDNMSVTEPSQEVMYDLLTEWLYKKTGNISKGACAIIISFFIQNCEVFS
ncbi:MULTISPECIES: ABC-three component system protein [Bacillus]|uniref:HNH endonuclease n=1 Tax=Bacillus pumilus TaxID=1408 RepID=A0AB34QVP2_BACPU|nr:MULTISPECIES: ABC-three component system protein [Bacillus]KIL20595.1 hypothetical protein B4127_2879 [Bacillus pumilus]MBU8575940.1 HNH endonuclease [Bacillus pumilus]OBS84934.1 hypothetical protein BAY68_09380 [Bacillus pumilus]PRR93428.1 HNH endonuclease [Bacillus sp. NMCN1]PRS00980.1 HNH endonuclease [Bacillus sp. NMCN6]